MLINAYAWVVTVASVTTIALLLACLNRSRRRLQREKQQFRRITNLLKASESHLQTVLDSTRDGIICIDNEGIITDFNRGAQNIFGYDSAEVVGLHVNVILPDKEKHSHSEHIRRASLSERKVINAPRQLYGRHKDGSLVPVEIALNRMQEDGNTRYVGVVRDVTELVTERNNLAAALQEARNANEAKDRLLSSASHELRTPLNAIMGFSELLLDEQEMLSPQARRSYLRDINGSAELLLLLVNDVLDMAKLHYDGMRIVPERVDLSVLARRCIRTINANFAHRKMTLDLQGPDCCWVWADTKRLQQVLLNLMSNACKYNYPGGNVTVKIDRESDENVRVEVQDNGLGVAPEQQDLLFQPFERLHSAHATIEGTGLGLSICKSLVESMGGEIGYRNNPQGGSIFHFSVPASDAPAENAPAGGKTEPRETSDQALQVLYVEDNPVNVRLMQAALERLGVVMTAIDSAEKALVYLDRARCDVILMDINLPGMSGDQAARELRQDPRLCDIPIIAVSASVDVVMHGQEKLFQAYIGKPFKLERIRRALEQVKTLQAEH